MVTFGIYKATGLLLLLTRAAAVQLDFTQVTNFTQTNTTQMNFTQMNFFTAIGDVALDNSTSLACAAALKSSLSCPSQFTNYPLSDYAGPFTSEDLDSFCSSTCTASISRYQSSVFNSCKGSHPFQELPATLAADRMAAYQHRTCLKDMPTGQYCHSKSITTLIEYPLLAVCLSFLAVQALWLPLDSLLVFGLYQICQTRSSC